MRPELRSSPSATPSPGVEASAESSQILPNSRTFFEKFSFESVARVTRRWFYPPFPKLVARKGRKTGDERLMRRPDQPRTLGTTGRDQLVRHQGMLQVPSRSGGQRRPWRDSLEGGALRGDVQHSFTSARDVRRVKRYLRDFGSPPVHETGPGRHVMQLTFRTRGSPRASRMMKTVQSFVVVPAPGARFRPPRPGMCEFARRSPRPPPELR